MTPPLLAGDVLPALQIAQEHAHEAGWEAVRLSRPNMRAWTAARLAVRLMGWREIVVFSRMSSVGGITSRSVRADQLMLVKRGSDLETLPKWAHRLPVGVIPRPDEVPPNRDRGHMTFEARWRAVTMLRLVQEAGWTHRRIGEHFGVTAGRAGQLSRIAEVLLDAADRATR